MMTTALDQPAVRAYLTELRRLLADAPDRDLVVDGVSRHIEDALADGPIDEARTRAVLDELGDPAVIAAEAAGEPAAPAPATPFLDRPSGGLTTVLVLTFGGILLPVAGWVVGLVMLWRSRGWTVTDKLIGTFGPALVTLVLAGAAALLPAQAAAPVHLAILGGLALGGIAVAVVLVLRFRGRG